METKTKTRALGVAVGAALTAVALIGVGGSPVSAGCGITLELYNSTSATVTVDWDDSDSRLADMWWKRIGSGSTSIGAGDTVYRNFTVDFGCDWWRQYRIDVNQGGSSWFEYEPSPSGVTSDITPRITIN